MISVSSNGTHSRVGFPDRYIPVRDQLVLIVLVDGCTELIVRRMQTMYEFNSAAPDD